MNNLSKLIIISWSVLSPILGMAQNELKMAQNDRIFLTKSSSDKCGNPWTSISLSAQLHPDWCYAACTQMVLNFFSPNTPITQCEIVNEILDKRYTQNNGGCFCHKDTLNGRSWQLSNAEWDKWVEFFKGKGLERTTQHRRLDMNIIKRQLDNCSPVIAGLHTNAAGYHAVVISGYFEGTDVKNGKRNTYLIIIDPNEKCRGCRYVLKVSEKRGRPTEFESLSGHNIYYFAGSKMITF